MTTTRPREELAEIGETLLEAIDEFVQALTRAGARDSEDPAVRRFCAYHLADLEGNDRGGGWLARNLLADELRALVAGDEEDEE